MDIVVLIFLLAFQVKHLIVDFYLQTPYMYENKGKKEGWVQPLALHASYHAVATYGIMLVWLNMNQTRIGILVLGAMVLFDFVSHFIVDRWKATQPDTPDTTKFWTNLGWDQFWHHTVGILIVFATLSYT